jgi:adenylate cyclase class 2
VIEREIKIPVDDLSPVRRRLEAGPARLLHPSLREHNLLFDNIAGDLEAAGSMLRIRQTGDRAVLTFKGPATYRGAVKERREINVEIPSGDLGAELLVALGFRPSIRYEKDRESWVLGEVRVDLDHTVMGNFVEIEGPADAIEAATRTLRLDPTRAVAGSYISLWQSFRRSHPRLAQQRDMVFD